MSTAAAPTRRDRRGRLVCRVSLLCASLSDAVLEHWSRLLMLCPGVRLAPFLCKLAGSPTKAA